MRRIALLTDFGTRDPYVASMKGVLAARTAAPVDDLTHEIAPFDVWEAAWFLRTAAPWWPGGTIFVAVVDPGVGTSRRIVAAERDGRCFLAPDNGLLTFVAGEAEWRSVENEGLFLPGNSTTFHGRDRFAPVAAALANGMRLAELGPRVEALVTLDYQPPERIGDGVVRGTIVHIDRFGNAITDVEPPFESYAVTVGGRTLDRVERTYAEASPGPFLIVGSGGTIEISISNANAAKDLQLSRGERLDICRIDRWQRAEFSAR